MDKANVIMFAKVSPDTKEVRIGLKKKYSDYSFAGNYTITIRVQNFLKQTITTRIVVELEAKKPVPVAVPLEIVKQLSDGSDQYGELLETSFS